MKITRILTTMDIIKLMIIFNRQVTVIFETNKKDRTTNLLTLSRNYELRKTT